MEKRFLNNLRQNNWCTLLRVIWETKMNKFFLYNTLSREKQEFEPADGKTVRLYTCGPTVYDFAHIGNFRAYVWEDVLRRWFEYKGWRVEQVMNLTDVDDKTIAGAREHGIWLKEFTQKYSDEFFKDLAALNIEKAEHYPKATDHVPEMEELIKTLLKKGVAYLSEDGSAYYNVRKFPEYGKLSHTKLGELKPGARVSHDSYDKESASDFALWKAWDAQDGDVYWQAEFGKGRPGWHIECSAMAMKYLGKTLDAHAGGVDLVFPHHENEIAQSEAGTGKPFSRFWLHCEHLLVNGRKMSKSLGNFYTLRDVLARGHSPAGVRWLLLAAHYRQQLNFTFEGLKGAEETVQKLVEFVERLEEAAKNSGVSEREGKKQDELIEQIVVSAEKKFGAAMDDDLNTPHAISAVFELVREANKLLQENSLSKKGAKTLLQSAKKFDKVFGVLEIARNERSVSSQAREWVEQKIAERNAAREKKDFKKSDRIRKELAEKGIELQDMPQGTKWKKS